MSFTLGREFQLTAFGESHGRVVGAVVDGCPSGLPLTEGDVQMELDRRRPGQPHSTGRMEFDSVRLLSGTFRGRTNGGPIAMVIDNEDVDSSWYEANRLKPRPGHGDYTAHVKYGGFNDYRGGGFLSGRLTASMVMGGAVAKKLLSLHGVRVLAHVVQIGGIRVDSYLEDAEIEEAAAQSPVRCADRKKSDLMVAELERATGAHDSVGGAVECRVLNLPEGTGEPIFDSLESAISHGVFSIPGVKALEFGLGFRLSEMRGSEANDEFCLGGQRVMTRTNHSGGILGGISDGMPVVFRVGIKPTPSIGKTQRTVELKAMEEAELLIEGRHDPCIAPRAVPVVESITAVCIADLMLISQKIGRTVGDLSGNREQPKENR